MFIRLYLDLAAIRINCGDYVGAIGSLQAARKEAHALKSRKGQTIATHCVIAQQALMPYLMGVHHD